MQTFPEPNRGHAGSVFAVVVIGLVSYLTFSALQGEHGLFRLFQAAAQEEHLRGELEAVRVERGAIETKVRRLSLEALDAELLDEQARRVLGLAGADELQVR